MKTKLAGFAVAALLVLAASPSLAQEFEPKRGVYLGAGGAVTFTTGSARSINTINLANALPFVFSDFDDAFGSGLSFNGFLGIPVSDHVSVQGTVSMDLYDESPLQLEVYSMTADLRASPRLGKVDPFVLFGIGASVGSISEAGGPFLDDTNIEFTFTAAGGIDLYLTDSIAFSPEVRMRYLRVKGDKIFPVNVGANFIFQFE